MTRDLAREEMFCGEVEMLRHTLPQRPDGCSEEALRRGMEAHGVMGEVYDEVVRLMIAAKWIERRRNRLHATEAIARSPEWLKTGLRE